jgi:hypothetical protein
VVDRRAFPRRPLAEDVQCYIDGVRFDARTLDLSAGGAFIRTNRWRSVSTGALVGLVFPRNRLSPQTIFLFGRVVRVQDRGVEGLALAWEKGVTVAPAAELARFLNATFGIEDPVIGTEVSGPRGEVRTVFLFSSLPRFPAAQDVDEAPPALPPEAPPAAPAEVVVELADPFDASAMGAGGLQVSAADLEGLDLQVIALDSDGIHRREVPAEAPRSPTPVPAPAPERTGATRRGPVSTMVARDAELPVALAGVLEAGSDRLAVEVVRLGLEGARVRTAFAPIDPSAGVVLRFEIPARRGPVSMACLCREARTDLGPDGTAPGLQLRFEGLDEGGSPGVLERYLKFLQFQDLARS